MKTVKQLFLFAAVLLLIGSCKKDNNGDIPLGTFSGKVDGVLTDFRYGAEADVLQYTPYRLYVRGYSNQPSISQTGIMVSVFTDGKVAPGTFIEKASGFPQVEITYTEQNSPTDFSNAYASLSAVSPVTVTVISVDAEFVKGTFSGELTGTRFDGSPLKVQITDGKFHLRL